MTNPVERLARCIGGIAEAFAAWLPEQAIRVAMERDYDRALDKIDDDDDRVTP